MDKRMLLTLIYLDRRRSIEDKVGFSLYDLVTSCGYKIDRTKTGALIPFKKQLQFLLDNEMIVFDSDIKRIKGNSFVQAALLNNFDYAENYTIITADEIDKLFSSRSRIERANLFAVYLYMKSFMFQRNLDDSGNEFSDAKDKPTAYWGYIDTMVYELGIARETINRCIKEYIKLDLYKKYETGSYTTNDNGREITKNAPNIYVIHNENADQEINWALKKLQQIYKVDKFGDFKRRGKSPPTITNDDS